MAEKAQHSRLVLATAAGLCAALALAGGALVLDGLWTSRSFAECAGISSEQCLEREEEEPAARSFARYEAGLGFGFLCVGAGGVLWLWLDERRRRAGG